MKSNRLQLNPGKTDFLWWTTCRQWDQLSTILVCGKCSTDSCDPRSMGSAWVNSAGPCKAAGQHLQESSIKSCRWRWQKRQLPDSWSSRLIAAWHATQYALNWAARFICNCRKYDNVAALLHDLLCWFPVQYHIDYKLALFVNKSLSQCSDMVLGGHIALACQQWE